MDPTTVAAALDHLLNAEHFDDAAIAWLAHRERYPDAVQALLHVLALPPRRVDLIETLAARSVVLMFRIALVFSVIPNHWTEAEPFTLDHLRRIANGSDARRAERAREALAALGEIQWSQATRRERAAFVLAQIVAAR